jgi:ribosomal protein S18
MRTLTILILFVAILGCGNAGSETTDSIVKKSISEINSAPKKTPDDKEEVPSDISAEKQKIKTTKILKNKATNEKSESEIRSSSEESFEQQPAAMPKVDFSQVYPQILSSYVSSSGKVNYSEIKTNSQMLDQAINHYQENTPKSSWSSDQKLAYWINAYNLFTIKLIIDNYPISSIKNIANGKPWDKKFIQLDGKVLSLNDIENEIIRKQFNEPRIHFAVNCASISCPKLLNQQYTASNLNSQLEKQTKRYIKDKNENTFTSNSASISNIFDWYKLDFNGGVIPFLNKYLDNPLAGNAKITYQDYNWNLNN